MFSCQSVEVEPDGSIQNPFMDIKSYFELEMEKTVSGPVEKITRVGNEELKTILDEIDLKQELKLFAQADINKVAWYEKYSIDTVQTSANANSIIYKAQDEGLKTREINIHESNGKIDSIYIHNKLESMIMNSDQFLHYYPDQGYQVKIVQIGSLQKAENFEIKVRY